MEAQKEPPQKPDENTKGSLVWLVFFLCLFFFSAGGLEVGLIAGLMWLAIAYSPKILFYLLERFFVTLPKSLSYVMQFSKKTVWRHKKKFHKIDYDELDDTKLIRYAEYGDVEAQYRAGRLYECGELWKTSGEPSDFNRFYIDSNRAAYWYRRAIAQGHKEAKQALAQLHSRLAEQAAAQRAAQAAYTPPAPRNPLDALIGLQSVKDELLKIEKSIRFERERSAKVGAPPAENARYNFLFTGNPGTGKTTVARCLAGILCKTGAIPINNLVEASRSDLVGKYAGHTAQQTQEVVERAWGGVLFIDEAYALINGENDSFGREALDTLVKLMEDNKDHLAVIFAGYAKEMDELLQQNSGLKSRFNRRIDFPDYSEDELLLIARQIAAKRAYTMSAGAERAFRKLMAREKLKPGFANARTATELMQAAFERHALHAEEEMARNPDYLHTLTEADFGVHFDAQENLTLDALRASLMLSSGWAV